MSKIKTYLKTILIPLIISGIITIFTKPSTAYQELINPPLAPPSIVVPIVWTILYILIGISYGMLVINKDNDETVKKSYYTQLILNFLWPVIFFGLKWRFIALIWIILLAAFVLKMLLVFYKKSKKTGLLQIPYLIWVLFATYLNLFFYILNR